MHDKDNLSKCVTCACLLCARTYFFLYNMTSFS